DSELGDDPAPAPIQHLHRVLAEDLVAGHGVDEHGSSPRVLDVAVGTRNISTVEQQFQGGVKAGTNGRPTGTTAVDRGADLLVRVLESEEPVALAELASASGIPKSTASRLVS